MLRSVSQLTDNLAGSQGSDSHLKLIDTILGGDLGSWIPIPLLVPKIVVTRPDVALKLKLSLSCGFCTQLQRCAGNSLLTKVSRA